MGSVSAGGFSADLLAKMLQTERFGRAVRVVSETPSTIDLAKEWLRDGGPEGAVIIAGRQTEGRGRRGRQWASPEGGLWMSVIARPDIESARAGLLGIGFGLAAAEAVSAEAGCSVGVKWPNDLWLGGKKVGGVLVGSETRGTRVAAAVLSVGLNVNISAHDLPEEIRGTATSLWEETGREHGLEALAARILEKLEEMWPGIVGEGEEIVARYRARDVLVGLDVSVAAGESIVRGRADGIDAGGALVLRCGSEKKRVTAGDVSAVRMVTG